MKITNKNMNNFIHEKCIIQLADVTDWIEGCVIGFTDIQLVVSGDFKGTIELYKNYTDTGEFIKDKIITKTGTYNMKIEDFNFVKLVSTIWKSGKAEVSFIAK